MSRIRSAVRRSVSRCIARSAARRNETIPLLLLKKHSMLIELSLHWSLHAGVARICELPRRALKHRTCDIPARDMRRRPTRRASGTRVDMPSLGMLPATRPTRLAVLGMRARLLALALGTRAAVALSPSFSAFAKNIIHGFIGCLALEAVNESSAARRRSVSRAGSRTRGRPF